MKLLHQLQHLFSKIDLTFVTSVGSYIGFLTKGAIASFGGVLVILLHHQLWKSKMSHKTDQIERMSRIPNLESAEIDRNKISVKFRKQDSKDADEPALRKLED